MPSKFSFRIQKTILLNCSKPTNLPLRDYHTLKCLFPENFELASYGKEQPHHISIIFLQQIQFALCRFQSLLLTASQLISFPPLTKMFQFRGFPILSDHLRRNMKTHSGISGSKDTCSLPEHSVACHTLLRRWSLAIHLIA